jgi:hypothetical protein
VPARAIFSALALLACIARRRRSRCCQPPRVWCLRHIQKRAGHYGLEDPSARLPDATLV